MLKEQSIITKNLEEYSNVEAALKVASNLNLDLSSVRKLNKFYADIFIIDSKDENEIQKSLNDLPVYVNNSMM